MNNQIKVRLATENNKSIRTKLTQTFDSLSVLSLNITSEELYTKYCSDWGVVVGRVVANNGVGVPNVRLSIFIPLDEVDLNDPIVSRVYPYTTTDVTNENGVRYNLLPNTQQSSRHTPVGTFPSEDDLLNSKVLTYIHSKYYKYTTVSNASGDYMFLGVPVGEHLIHYDMDISDVDYLSVIPEQLIQQGELESSFKKNVDQSYSFKASSNLDSLLQVRGGDINVNVAPFWGDSEQCDVGISRVDINVNYVFEPYAVFFGNIFGDSLRSVLAIDINKTPNLAYSTQPLIDDPYTSIPIFANFWPGVPSPLAVSQPLQSSNYVLDTLGDEYKLYGVVDVFTTTDNFEYTPPKRFIFEEKNFLLYLPMTSKYYITNEFGEFELADVQDGTKGIATEGYYSFVFSIKRDGLTYKRYSNTQTGLEYDDLFPLVGSFSPRYYQYLNDKTNYASVIPGERGYEFYANQKFWGNFDSSTASNVKDAYMFTGEITKANPQSTSSANYNNTAVLYYGDNPVTNVPGKYIFDIINKKINFYTIGMEIRKSKSNDYAYPRYKLFSNDPNTKYVDPDGTEYFYEPQILTNIYEETTRHRKIPSSDYVNDFFVGEDKILIGSLYIPAIRALRKEYWNSVLAYVQNFNNGGSGLKRIYENYEMIDNTDEEYWLNSNVISTHNINVTDIVNQLPETSAGFVENKFKDGNYYYFGPDLFVETALTKVKKLFYS